MSTPTATLQLPESPNTVRVRMFDTTTNMTVGARDFVEPVLPGHESFNLTTVGFLIENRELGKKALFDLGCKKDYWNSSPAQASRLERIVIGLEVNRNVNEILEEAGVDLESIDHLIWSHMHWDHIGDLTLFPKSVSIVVGRDFTASFLPAYPTNPHSRLQDSWFHDRHLQEISFRSDLRIGEFSAHDFFNDGSFYLLHAPGHCTGHMCGLARTTPETFVFLGGDICHYPGMFRPNAASPLPDQIPASARLDPYFPSPCPCSVFDDVHPMSDKSEARHQPFYSVTRSEHSSYADREQAIIDIRKLQAFDASPNVLVAVAHDPNLLQVLPILNDAPEMDINAWKAKGWKEEIQWGFLNELPRRGKRGRERLVDGLWREGKFWKEGAVV